MKLFAIILFGIQSITIKAIPMNMLLVKDYLKFTNISICVFHTCENITERVKNLMDFQNDDIWMNFLSVTDESEIHSLNYTNILVRLASPLCVVINLECDKSVRFMEEISSRKMFHYERFWLIFGTSFNEAYAQLRHQFINMDAEIYLALPNNKTYILKNKLHSECDYC